MSTDQQPMSTDQKPIPTDQKPSPAPLEQQSESDQSQLTTPVNAEEKDDQPLSDSQSGDENGDFPDELWDEEEAVGHSMFRGGILSQLSPEEVSNLADRMNNIVRTTKRKSKSFSSDIENDDDFINSIMLDPTGEIAADPLKSGSLDSGDPEKKSENIANLNVMQESLGRAVDSLSGENFDDKMSQVASHSMKELVTLQAVLTKIKTQVKEQESEIMIKNMEVGRLKSKLLKAQNKVRLEEATKYSFIIGSMQEQLEFERMQFSLRLKKMEQKVVSQQKELNEFRSKDTGAEEMKESNEDPSNKSWTSGPWRLLAKFNKLDFSHIPKFEMPK